MNYGFLLIFLILTHNLLHSNATTALRDPFSFIANVSTQTPCVANAENLILPTAQENKQRVEIRFNDQLSTVAVGDYVGQWEVAEISGNTVILKNKQGQVHTLSVNV